MGNFGLRSFALGMVNEVSSLGRLAMGTDFSSPQMGMQPAPDAPAMPDPSAGMRAPSVQDKWLQGMINRGIDPVFAKGMMPNIWDESGWNTSIQERNPIAGRGGKGAYQLTGDRRTAFESRYGNDYSDDNQMDFLAWEVLNGPEKSNYQRILKESDGDVRKAAAGIVKHFLRPSQENADRRASNYLGGNFSTRSPNLPVDSGGMPVDTSTMENANEDMSPEASKRRAQGALLMGIGQGLGQMSRGQPVDISSVMNAFYDRQSEARKRLMEIAQEKRRQQEFNQQRSWNVQDQRTEIQSQFDRDVRQQGFDLERDSRQNSYALDRDQRQNDFTLGRDAMQNDFTRSRDQEQNDFTLGRDAMQNDFTLSRDKEQNDFTLGRDAMQNDFTKSRDAAQNDFTLSRDDRLEQADVRAETRAQDRLTAQNQAVADGLTMMYPDNPNLSTLQAVAKVNPDVALSVAESQHAEAKAAKKLAEEKAQQEEIAQMYEQKGFNDLATTARAGDVVGARDIYKERTGTTDAQLDAAVLQKGGPAAIALAQRLRLEAGVTDPQISASMDLEKKYLLDEGTAVLANKEKQGQLEAMQSLLAPGVDTGKFQALALPFRQVMQDFGLGDTSTVDRQTVVDAIGNNLISYMRKPGEGVVSDADAGRFAAAAPGLGKSPIANQVLTYVHLSTLQREEAAHDARFEYFARGGDVADVKSRNAFIAAKVKEQFGDGAMLPEAKTVEDAATIPDGKPYIIDGKFYINTPSGTIGG